MPPTELLVAAGVAAKLSSYGAAICPCPGFWLFPFWQHVEMLPGTGYNSSKFLTTCVSRR